MSLSSALVYLGFEPLTDFVLLDNGSGPVISQWLSASTQPTQQEIEAAELPAAMLERINAINDECRARIIARYGSAEEQVSRAIGVYGADEQAAMSTGIAATIDASNVAQNEILAAVDIAAVEAVTVSWPVI